MQKKLSQYAYLGGLVCAAIAIVWRAATLAGVAMQVPVNYMTFYKGALLLLVVAIASGTAREA